MHSFSNVLCTVFSTGLFHVYQISFVIFFFILAHLFVCFHFISMLVFLFTFDGRIVVQCCVGLGNLSIHFLNEQY